MQQEIIDPRVYRDLGNCFYLLIPVCDSDEEFNALMQNAQKVEQATKLMLDGSITIEDLLEAVEAFIPSIDNYIEEVSENMEQALIKIYHY